MRRPLPCLLAALIALLSAAATPASAQIAKLPAEVRDKIAAMGAKLDGELVRSTMAVFAPLAEATPAPAGVTVSKDVSYGPDPLNTIDLYRPMGKQDMPIIVFVHGGAFVRGDKNGNGPIYGNVARWFARHGILAVNANYRLAPKSPWPAGGEDVGKIVAWLRAHGAAYGGAPGRIFVIGHSAGATHVASYILDAALQPKEGPGVAGAVLISGSYRVTAETLSPEAKAYFGADASQFAARSPITHVNESKVPLMIVTAEYDPVFLATPSLELAALVCARDGKCPRMAWLKGHNHISEVASFDTADQALGEEILDFIASSR